VSDFDLDPPPAPPEDPPPGNAFNNPEDVPTSVETGPPTHIHWVDGGAQLVTLDGYDENNPDLEELPAGVGIEFLKVDSEARTIELDTERLDAILHAQIDQGAGTYRMKFITEVPGQQMTYIRKEKEAREFIADGPGPFVTLEAEAAATDQQIADLAALVVSQADQLIALGAAIEGMRMGAKKAVTLASTAGDKHAAAAVQWESIAG
jgi:hypothetical protein